jgi:exosome complex RNA-binding protein Csl4
MPLLLSLFVLLTMVVPVASAEPSLPTAGTEVKGDVLYWEGEEVIVREISGHQARLRVTTETKIQGASGRLKTGDKIAAQVTPDGQALSITLQVPDSGSVPR